MFSMLGSGFAFILSDPFTILLLVLGVAFGIVFGALPELTTVAALSMFLPLSYSMNSTTGLATLTAIYHVHMI